MKIEFRHATRSRIYLVFYFFAFMAVRLPFLSVFSSLVRSVYGCVQSLSRAKLYELLIFRCCGSVKLIYLFPPRDLL
jgi:hypothetical protein